MKKAMKVAIYIQSSCIKNIVSVCTVDRVIFVVKIIRFLNFRVKNISPPDGSAINVARIHIFYFRVFNLSPPKQLAENF